MGDSDPDTYAAISEAITRWQPSYTTKQDIEESLMKCFKLDENEILQQLIAGQ